MRFCLLAQNSLTQPSLCSHTAFLLLSIYIPEGYDVFLPINNNEVRFDISGDMGNWDSCNQWLQDGVSFCKVDKGWVSSYHTNAKITVSGLGRVNGWYTMNKQRDDNIRRSKGEPGDVHTVSDGSNFSGYWSNVGMWYIYGKRRYVVYE